MPTKEMNPLEQLELDLADAYVGLVHLLAGEIAPFRPWWSKDLSSDEQLWRYEQHRAAIVGWLQEAMPFMGWATWEDALKGLDDLFSSPATVDLLPMDLVVDERADIIREMVQAVGPRATAVHIRKMEKMAEGRAAAVSRLAVEAVDIPELVPPLPIETLPNTGGWPLHGGAGQLAEIPPGFQAPV